MARRITLVVGRHFSSGTLCALHTRNDMVQSLRKILVAVFTHDSFFIHATLALCNKDIRRMLGCVIAGVSFRNEFINIIHA